MIGPESKVKLKIDGVKYDATVREVRVDTAEIEVTSDGTMGIPADTFRRFAPGLRTITVTLEVVPRP